ncbi:hypothetical protein PMIN01_05371 [Paraphaeosphaeria minitans]|uniref:Uncharacterized protein n=1 Tax=Paraphaeosphaeria minitans TaxID=565426 RepID=A0A9P6GL17_9PLEO|nr:hypothetical protein PMIN01_05371 [Paraphaeosphaeria minitans]
MANDTKVPDLAYQLPTPPRTPSSRDTLLDAKNAVDPVVNPGAYFTSTIDATSQDKLVISDFFACPEDNEHYYLGNSG